MYKVFYNDKAISMIEKSESLPEDAAKKIVDNKQEFYGFLDAYFKQKSKDNIVISGDELSKMFIDFKSYFKYVEAAGGLVENNEGKHLFIKRWGIWDLPKGKVENNEPYEKAAIREVEEETGIGKLRILQQLENTYHIYQTKKALYLKCTFWFLMSTDDNQIPKPQLNEGITDVAWFNREQSKKALSESYRSLKETMMCHLSMV